MNGAQDLGGMMGFGPVEREPDEPWFHADWERRAFGLTLAMGATGAWTLDASRFAREDRPVDEYLRLSYYEIWFEGLQRLLVDNRLVSAEEVRSGRTAGQPAPIKRRLEASDVDAALRRRSSTERPQTREPLFAVGDHVRTRRTHDDGHTRLPTYARDRKGQIAAVHGCHVFPDTNAHGQGEQPQWLYTVAFTTTELFGPAADPRASVSIDAFEPYLLSP